MVVLLIFGIIGRFVGTRKEVEESPLNQRIRINEMKMTETVNESNNAEGQNDKTSAEEKWDTLNLMENILTAIGCQPKKGNEKELLVAYQGENFVINIGGPYAQIWDPSWAQINVNDPNFENMKTAANISNFDFGPSIVWTSPNEDGFVSLHSKREILLSPQLQDSTAYVRSVLDSFFEKKDRMRGQLHALINQQQQSPKHNRPVGFVTTEE